MKTLDASSYTTALNARREQILGQKAYDKLLDMLVGREPSGRTVLHERTASRDARHLAHADSARRCPRLETEGRSSGSPAGCSS